MFFLGSVCSAHSQTRPQWTLTPSVGLGYKLSDWLYGAPPCLGIQGQVIIKDKVLLESWFHATAFKDAIFKGREFTKLFGSDRVLHSLKVVGLGMGYHANLFKRNHLQVSGGIVWVNYKEPYVESTGSIILSGYNLDYYSHNYAGLYGKIQYNVFLNEYLYLSLGSTALSCRGLSYGVVHSGCTFWFPHK